MKSLCTRLAVLALSFSVVSAQAEDTDLHQSVDTFLTKGRGILVEIKNTSPDAAKVISDVNTMIEATKPVQLAFIEKHPACKEQITSLLAMYDQINTMSAADIRRNIEQAQGLPPGTGCYPARDIVAHPSIVRALSRDGIDATETRRLAAEMGEALHHMEALGKELAP